MGYRVGLNCFGNIETANDYVLSQIAPVITVDGKIIAPEKVGKDWFLSGEKITLSYPECSVTGQMADGAKMAVPFVMIFVLMFAFRLVGKFINGMGVFDGG